MTNNKYLIAVWLCVCFVGCITDSNIDKILSAKDRVRSIVNYPDTLSFHEFDTKVNGNIVTLKFTCKNGFGVPETHVIDINVAN